MTTGLSFRGIIRRHQALLLVIVFLSVSTARSVLPHDYGEGKSSASPPFPLYMPYLSLHLGLELNEIEQWLRHYDRCRKDLIHPIGSPIENYWQCEQVWFPENLLQHTLEQVEYYLEYYSSPTFMYPPRHYDSSTNSTPDSNIIEEFTIYHNIVKLIEITSMMQKFRAWRIDSSIFPLVKEILRLWAGNDGKANSWIAYQEVKYHEFYSDNFTMLARGDLRNTARLKRLVLDFEIEPLIWPTLPAEMSTCPSSILPQWRKEISGLSQLCYNEQYAEDMLYKVPEGPVVFRQFAKPYQKEYECCCEQVDRWRGIDIEANRIRDRVRSYVEN